MMSSAQSGPQPDPSAANASADASGAASGSDSSASQPQSSAPAPARKKRGSRTADQILAEQNRLFQERQAREKKAHDARVAKLLEKAVPLSKRKSDAFDLLQKLRETVKKHADHGGKTEADVDALIVHAVAQAFPLPAEPPADKPEAQTAGAAA